MKYKKEKKEPDVIDYIFYHVEIEVLLKYHFYIEVFVTSFHCYHYKKIQFHSKKKKEKKN